MDDRTLPRGVASSPGGAVVVHFDGACQPAHGGGVATYGYTVEGHGLEAQDGDLAVPPFSERATNNVAEYVGAIRALEYLRASGYRGPVEVVGDSELVIRQMQGRYEVKAAHLHEYHDRLTQLAGEFESVDWRSVPREENARADEISKRALDARWREARAGLRVRPPPTDRGD